MAAVLTACVINCHAQTDTIKTKMFNHYVGVQINELLKQIINLNSEAEAINNPYLVTYSLHLAKSGWGINTGIGYDYKKIIEDGAGDIETTFSDLSFRVGLGRQVMLGKKFEAGYAFEYVFRSQVNETFSSLVTDFGAFTDSTATTVTHKIIDNGLGGQVNLAFHITNKILVGTEATGYYIKSKDKETTEVSTLHSNNSFPSNTLTTETTKAETVTDTFTFTIPVAIFLIIKF